MSKYFSIEEYKNIQNLYDKQKSNYEFEVSFHNINYKTYVGLLNYINSLDKSKGKTATFSGFEHSDFTSLSALNRLEDKISLQLRLESAKAKPLPIPLEAPVIQMTLLLKSIVDVLMN